MIHFIKTCLVFVKIVSEGRRQEKYESPADVLPRNFIYLFSEGRRQEKIITCPRPAGQFYLCMQDVGRIKSIAEDNLMFVYERVFPPVSTPLLSG